MKHSDLKIGMKVKRVSNFNSGFYTSTKDNISTVSVIHVCMFKTEENGSLVWDPIYFEPVQETKEKEMQKIDINKKYKTRCGYPVRILCVDRDDKNYPVVALFGDGDMVHSFSINGKYFIEGEHKYDLIEVSPWEDFKKDDKVMVRNYKDGPWFKRYFAYEKEGSAYCYTNGTNSWTEGTTVGVTATSWMYCRKPTQEELES